MLFSYFFSFFWFSILRPLSRRNGAKEFKEFKEFKEARKVLTSISYLLTSI